MSLITDAACRAENIKIIKTKNVFCRCGKPGVLEIWGYTEDEDMVLCRFCAHQVVRKILEDLCEIEGDRHG